MKHFYFGKLEDIELRPLSFEDLETLRNWRNDKNLTKYLRPIAYITKEMQEKWFLDYLEDKDIFTFSIFETNELKRLVGSVSIYNFRSSKAEIGKIQIGDSEAHGRGIGKKALAVAMKIGFEKMGLSIFDISINQNNVPSYNNAVAIGFKKVDTKESDLLGKEDVFEIDYRTLKDANDYIDRIVIGTTKC